MNIKEIKKKCPNEWVLVEVLKEDESGNPIEVKLIEHSKNRDDTYSAMKKHAEKYTYHFYTGEIPKKGYAVAFYRNNTTNNLLEVIKWILKARYMEY